MHLALVALLVSVGQAFHTPSPRLLPRLTAKQDPADIESPTELGVYGALGTAASGIVLWSEYTLKVSFAAHIRI